MAQKPCISFNSKRKHKFSRQDGMSCNMMALNCSLLNTLVVVIVLFKEISANTDSKWEPKTSYVQLTSDSPTTLGGTTTLFAEAVDCLGLTFRFSFTYASEDIVKIVNSNNYNFSTSSWKSSKKYEVTLDVERIKPYKYCGKATTYVIVTDTITASLQTDPSREGDYNIGPVLLSVNIHDPSHMFRKISYYWDFGDGVLINNTLIGEISHNFTEIKTYVVKVAVFAMAKGRWYNGTTHRTMKFNGGFMTHVLVIDSIDSKNMSTLRLPSRDNELIYVSLGQEVQFIVLYNNPYSIVQMCYAQWSIQAANTCSLKHTFIKKGTINVYVTPTFKTKQGYINQDPIQKKLFVEEPISGLTLERKNYTLLTTYLEVNISCNGGAPFKMCWRLSGHSSAKFDNPLMENCTGLSETCMFHINRHTLLYKGRLQLDIIVINRVGSANLVEQFTIPETVPPHNNHRKETTTISIIVPIFAVCFIVLVMLIYIIRKVYKIRHRSVLERANFDFRDEDSQSVDSLYFKKTCCPSFKFWRKNKEYYPLLENWDSHPSSGSLYSDLL